MHSAKAITDENRGLKIGYTEGNNMPALIAHEGGTIMNRYSFGGQKLGRNFTDVKGQLISDETYYGNLVMEKSDPRRILFEDGYIDLTPGQQPVFNYHLKDHLGNVRIVLQPGGNMYGKVVQSNDYFPFGMAYTKERMRFKIPAFISVSDDNSYTAESPTYSKDNRYLYNGKEEQPMPGKWLDYGARFYDAQLGRWHSVDPSADEVGQEVASPYCYVENNPVSRNDPDGRIWSNIIGAVVGGGVELAGQAIAQMASGKSLSDVDIDWVDVGAATLEGGLTSGGSILRRVAVTTVSAGVQAAFDDNNNVITGDKSMTQAGKEFAGNLVTAGVGAGAQKVVNASTKEAVSSANKQVVRANNAVTTAESRLAKQPNSPKAQTNVNNAKSNAQTARNNQVKTQMTHNTVGQTNVTVKGQQVNVVQQTANTGANAAKNTIVDEKKR